MYEGIRRLVRPPLFCWARNQRQFNSPQHIPLLLNSDSGSTMEEIYNRAMQYTREFVRPAFSLNKNTRPLRMMCVTYNMAGEVFKTDSQTLHSLKSHFHDELQQVHVEDQAEDQHDHFSAADRVGKYEALDNGLAQLDDLFRRFDVWHDIYVLATQEAERDIMSSLFNDSKDQLERSVKKYFGIANSAATLSQAQAQGSTVQ